MSELIHSQEGAPPCLGLFLTRIVSLPLPLPLPAKSRKRQDYLRIKSEKIPLMVHKRETWPSARDGSISSSALKSNASNMPWEGCRVPSRGTSYLLLRRPTLAGNTSKPDRTFCHHSLQPSKIKPRTKRPPEPVFSTCLLSPELTLL